MKVTFLIPTLDEEGGIGPTLDAIDRRAFEAKGWDVECVVVDGDSKDRTREVAKAKGARVVVEARRGYGRAYKVGFAEAKGDVIVTADADGTYPLERAHEFVQRLVDEGLDFLNCDRYGNLEPGSMSRKHLFGNWVLSTTARTLFAIALHDSQSGMWVIRRESLRKVDYGRLSDGMAFSQEIKIAFCKAKGMRVAEAPASLKPRIGRPQLSSWKDGLRNLGRLYKLRVAKRW